MESIPAPCTDGVWARTDLQPDGTYITCIQYGPDLIRALDREAAYAYAAEICRAAVAAQHDAAVIRQLRSANLPLATAVEAVRDLRADRPPIDDGVTAPLRLAPGVTAKTGDAFLALHVQGRQIGQWEPADAFQHAADVLAVLAATDLDAAYRRYLVGTIGLEPTNAVGMITLLGEHTGSDRG